MQVQNSWRFILIEVGFGHSGVDSAPKMQPVAPVCFLSLFISEEGFVPRVTLASLDRAKKSEAVET